ncbi:mucin-21 [Prunus yedoensis var. nudiflora]|uniref:Mucin-21 n=1 Tax=Prunus yedoensis var. nudiflora TaxID=2094558 RepID=A0A314Z1X3_PRUYE|nr:mucin-21 [Prunus yedoensis var. nudiflora]
MVPESTNRINIFSQNPCSHQLVQLLTLQVLDYTPTAKALQESSPTTTAPQENTLSAKGLKEYLPTVKALREYSAARAHQLYGVLECSPTAKVLLESSPTTTALQVNYLRPKFCRSIFQQPKLFGVFRARSPQFSPVFKALEYFPILKAPEYFPIVKSKLWVVLQQSAPCLFGTQSSVPTKHDASDEADVENDLEQPSSPSVKKSEEKGVVLVHEVKCKLYVKSSDPADKDAWKDKGTGQLSIKCKEGVSKGTKESKPTIIVRNDVGKVQLNALLYSGIKTNLQKNSIVAIFHTMGEGDGNDGSAVARTFLIRLKTEEDRNKLATAIQEYAPAS